MTHSVNLDVHKRRTKRDRSHTQVNEPEIQEKPKKIRGRMDVTIITSVAVLLVISCLLAYTTTFEETFRNRFAAELVKGIENTDPQAYIYGNSAFFSHLGKIGFGLLVAAVTVATGWWSRRLPVLLLWGVSWLMVLSLPLWGTSVNGQIRWLKLGTIQFQPSDLLKLALILFMASLLAKVDRTNENSPRLWLVSIFGALLPAGVAATSDLSTGIVLVAIVLIPFLMSRYRAKRLTLFFLLIGVVGATIFIYMEEYRIVRVMDYIRLIFNYGELRNSGTQTAMGLKALTSGGWFGKGLGNSLMAARIPESQNDFIFTILCEEAGIVGGILVILLYFVLLFRIYQLALQTKKRLYFYILIGSLIHIGAQMVINIGVTLALVPNTGIGLPFLSSGGTSMSVFLVEIGVVLGISKRIDQEKRRKALMKV